MSAGPQHAPQHAMVLAAGLGLRMRPLTLACPKPLLPVAGRSMLDRVLDHLDLTAVPHRVVNAHWLGEQIHRHLAGRPGTVISDEEVLLETGGGIAKALPLLGGGSFYAANADILWTDGAIPALARLAGAWRDDAMDALLLLANPARAFGYDGPGDFCPAADGRLTRRRDGDGGALVFTGVQILHSRLFAGCPAGAFSLNRLYDRAQAEGRLFGLSHDGGWYHIGTPEALAEADRLLTA
ncbi:MAG TPA: nucleotidyltransferase family protein [Rhodospirillaceae bacterium]|nr:nucleotidyltransferase family protein [Rhodospirillaceae bacterium]